MTTTTDRTTELPRRRTVTTTVQPIDDVRRDDVPVAVLPDVAPAEQQGQMSHRQDWALGALAGWDEDDARTLTDLLDRLVADLESAGMPKGSVARTAVPAPR